VAERSFAKEVEQLRIGAGEEFRGEGILAVTKALLQCGVGYVAGYQGAPISHLMDVLADASDIMEELGIRFEASASEAAAAATLAASVHYPIRGAVTFKSTVGTNVASDALANLASGGVRGGALIVVGEDYGEGSSIMQERSHAFAMKSQIWLLDPRPNLPSIVKAVEDGFELSEASNTPVMLEIRIRACHVHGRFMAKDNRRPPFTVTDALETPNRDTNRIVLPPASFLHEQEKVHVRLPAAIKFIKDHALNETFGPVDEKVGIILQGGMYNGIIRALERIGLADVYGNTILPLYVLNVTYPLIDDEVVAFCRGKKAVLVVEEGQPDYIEQALAKILRNADVDTKLVGKGPLPIAGEYTTKVLSDGLTAFLRQHMPGLLPDRLRAPNQPAVEVDDDLKELQKQVPVRPAGFCTGCPERPIFSAMKLVEKELGEHQVASDIGCHLFSILPPFNIGGTTMGYGLGAASNSAFNGTRGEEGRQARPGPNKTRKRSIAVMGDGGFWHNGLTSGVGNAVFNRQDGVILVVDNNYTAATGGQDILSSRANNRRRSTKHPIEKAVEGIGVEWVRTIDRTYDVGRMRDALKEALTTPDQGPKVIVAASECMLNRQRRERPLKAKAIEAGKRVVKPRFGVDEDVCTGDHACIRLSGCPSLSVKKLDDPLRDDPVAAIDDSCVGCGNCGEVADAAVLCPSFYRTDLVYNPGLLERIAAKLRAGIIGYLQRRRAAKRFGFAVAQ
jgi:indolepyruvate ferredoxin oxidoreductase alpha subunit